MREGQSYGYNHAVELRRLNLLRSSFGLQLVLLWRGLDARLYLQDYGVLDVLVVVQKPA